VLARRQTSIKVDPIAWESAQNIFKEYNLTLSDAINIFLNKVRLEGGMPFDIKVPSSQLKTAMRETQAGQGAMHDNIEDMLKDLREDDI